MGDRPELRGLLHDLQSKSASLGSAARLLKGDPSSAREMLPLMIQETKEILLCLREYRKRIAGDVSDE